MKPTRFRSSLRLYSGDRAKIAALTAKGAEVLLCSGKDGAVDLHDLLRKLGARGIQSILLEAGERLCGEMLRNNLIDRFLLFYAPKILGGDGKGLFSGVGGAVHERCPAAFHQKSLESRQ